jgi:hypothetical protein
MLRNPTAYNKPRPDGWAIYLLLWLALTGCQSGVAPQPQAPPIPETPPAEIKKIDPVVLHNLLDTADAAIAQGHLTFPQGNNAYDIYQRILALEPGQQDAVRGLENLVEEYVALAIQALERNQPATARSMLARARLIVPDHASIEPTEAQIRLLTQAQRKSLKLAQNKLNKPESAVGRELQALAQVAQNTDCRFIISAKNDAQGRWIYQQLAKGATQTRIRAQIRIRLPASVERLCFPS